MVLRSVSAAALGLVVSISAAFAQSTAPAAAPGASPAVDVRALCKADMDKLCPNVERGDARRACIDTNKDKFSEACKTARSAARDAGQDRREAFRAVCAGDIAKLCANVERGQGHTVDCMRTNADKLTPTCKTELSNLPANAARSAQGAAAPDATRKQ